MTSTGCDSHSCSTLQDLEYFTSCLDAIRQTSKNAHIFCLIHKMDLIQKEEDRQKVLCWTMLALTGGCRLQIFEERAAELQAIANGLHVTAFGTSIWDETLYKARFR